MHKEAVVITLFDSTVSLESKLSGTIRSKITNPE